MTVGTSTYMGLAVPLYGEAIITQTTGATDILTIEGGNGQTGDFIVARASTETERFVVEDGGNVVITQAAAADIGLSITQYSTPTASALNVYSNDGSTVRFAVTKNHGVLLRVRTTKPTTGLTKGELLLLFHGSTPKLAVCTSTAGDTLKMIRLKTKTLGRLTA
jgi:hypothetical protein